MAGGYLGKISAIVTANTGDFKPKLDAAAKDVTSFAKSVQSTLSSSSSASTAALRAIYTEAQKFDRALAAATSKKLSFKGFDSANLGEAANKAKQLFSATNQVTKPLADAAKSFGKLSYGVQAEFLPALVKAQRLTEALSSTISRTGQVGEERFGRIQRKVEAVTESMSRIREAEGLVGSLATGRELAFQQPGLVSENARARALQNKALSLSPGDLASSGIAGLVGQQRAAAEEANRLYSALERVKSSRNGDAAAAEAALTNQLALYSQVNAQIEREINNIQAASVANERGYTTRPAGSGRGGLGLFGTAAGTATDQAMTRARELSSQFDALPASAQNSLRGLAGIVSNVADGVRDGTASAEHLNQVLDRLAARMRDQSIGQTSSRATPIGDYLRMKEEDDRRSRDAAIEQNLGIVPAGLRQFSRRASNLGPGGPENPPDGTNYFADQLERNARRRMGGDVPEPGGRFDVGRQVDNVIDRVGAARSKLDSLPESIRARLIPSLQRATESAATLARSGFGATAAQIRNATAEAARLEQRVSRAQRANNFSEQFGGPGRRGVEMQLQSVQLNGYTAQLQLLQRELAGVSTQARAAATGPFNALRAAIENAAANGTLGLRRTRQEIQQLLQDAARATAGATGGNQGGLMRRLQRAGDVGRGGFDKFTLAAQQAVFAIDDFFSVTGDFSQRMRAIGNNLTQIGFVMGGLTGLAISLAASLAAQGVAAYIKYANSGREAEDAAKALNGTLERQKSTVESLADAFRSISSDIASRGFKGATKDAAELSQRMDEIRNKQKERKDERNAALSPEVQTIRATIAAREKELSKTSDIGRAAILTAEIAELRDRERQEVRRLRQPVRIDQALEELDASRRRVSEGRATDVRSAAGGQAGAAPGVLARQRENQQNDARREAELANVLGAANKADALSRTRGLVERQLAEARETARRERADSFGFGTSYAGAAAEQEVARLQGLLNSVNDALQGSLDSLEIAVSRQALITAGKLGNALDLLSTAIGEEASLTLRGTSELTAFVDQLRDAQQRLADAVASGDTGAAQAAREEIEALRESTREQVSAANSVAAFAAALDKVSTQLINTVLAESRSSAEEARRAANAADVAERGPAAEQEARAAYRRRDRLDREMRESEDRERELRRDREQDVRDFEDDARSGRLDPQVQRLIRERDEAQAEIDRAVETNRPVNPDAVRRRDEAQVGLDRSFNDSVVGRVHEMEANDFDRENARRKRREEDITRGRELMRTPAERAGLELVDSLRGLQAAFDEDPAGDPVRLANRQRNLAQDAMRQAAPAIFNMADEVQNAILQGPSRAALQVSDVSTTQGAAELNRLLRGDDSAKNVNLVELQKQSQALTELVQIARENGTPPGIFDN